MAGLVKQYPESNSRAKKVIRGLQAMARKGAELDLREGWFGVIALSISGAEKSLPSAKDSPEHNELSARLAETIHCIAAEALVFLVSTASEVTLFCPCCHTQRSVGTLSTVVYRFGF